MRPSGTKVGNSVNFPNECVVVFLQLWHLVADQPPFGFLILPLLHHLWHCPSGYFCQVEHHVTSMQKLLSALPHANTGDLRFHGPIIAKYVPGNNLLVERSGAQASDPTHPGNHQLLMIQADGRDLFDYSRGTPLSSGKKATHSVLLKHLDNAHCAMVDRDLQKQFANSKPAERVNVSCLVHRSW